MSALAREILRPEAAGLRPSHPERPGFRRRRCGKGWVYLDAAGTPLSGKRRERCRELAIPPAWRDVWICPSPSGHIQACGQDDDGRRQYIYHPLWREAADAAKFADLLRFADRLPRLRARLRRIMAEPAEPERLALACVVALMDAGGLRIGSPRHWKQTGAVGAVTLQRHNLGFDRHGVHLDFTGKGGRQHRIDIADPELRDGLRQLARSNGDTLFQCDGQPLSAERVNRFIEELTGLGFTAKDFRTWGGSVAAASYLRADPAPTIGGACAAAAGWLGNTPAIARSSYIHPAIIERARQGRPATAKAGPARLRVDERVCYALIT